MLRNQISETFYVKDTFLKVRFNEGYSFFFMIRNFCSISNFYNSNSVIHEYLNISNSEISNLLIHFETDIEKLCRPQIDNTL